MATLYTQRQIQDVLKTLRIKPTEGNKVTTREAARILSWRAKAEHGVEREYLDSAVRRYIQLGKLTAYPAGERLNAYKAEDIFELPISPKRGLKKASPDSEK